MASEAAYTEYVDAVKEPTAKAAHSRDEYDRGESCFASPMITNSSSSSLTGSLNEDDANCESNGGFYYDEKPKQFDVEEDFYTESDDPDADTDRRFSTNCFGPQEMVASSTSSSSVESSGEFHPIVGSQRQISGIKRAVEGDERTSDETQQVAVEADDGLPEQEAMRMRKRRMTCGDEFDRDGEIDMVNVEEEETAGEHDSQVADVTEMNDEDDPNTTEEDVGPGERGSFIDRKLSSSFSDLGDYDDFSFVGAAGDGSYMLNTTNSTFYPISEEAFRFSHATMGNGGGYHHVNMDRNTSSSNGSPVRYGGRNNSFGGRSTPTYRVVMPTDESQPLVGGIYPVSGELLRLKVDNAAYIIFYKSGDGSDNAGGRSTDMASSSSSDENGDYGHESSDDGTSISKPPRSLASLGAAGHKVQTTNCFSRDYTHPTRSLGRGLFRASTSVGSAFLKGAAGLVNQSYQGGANGGVFGFAKGLGMGMLGLGAHTVKGAFRGVGQVTNVVGEMVLGTAPHFSIDGALVLTNYRIIWMSQSTKDAIEIPISSILTVDSSTTAPHVATIECKSLLRASIAFQDETTCYDFLNCIWELYSGSHYLFAHLHYQALLLKDENAASIIETPTHRFYDPEEDYRRLRLLDEESWMRLYDNSDFALFPSYPEAFVIPSVLDDMDLRELSAYRSASRIPAVVWRHPHTGALVSRCAQPCAGLSGYVVEADQKLVAALQRATSFFEDSKFHFFDARSQMAATANSAQGKGTEDPRNYPNSELHFCDIANIHAVRSSYSALASICQPGQERYGTEWHYQLRNTFWFMHMSRILSSSQEICRWLCQGDSVMVHCSDGWDRTSQLTALVQLLLDPYYRTLRGLLLLIEKEWCSFGHMFRKRYGHCEAPGQQELEEQSPIFIQWLDAVWQIWRQQPWAFEFNETLLATLYEHTYSGLYGTFAYNNERERRQQEAEAPTQSLWFALLETRDKYINLEYDCAKNFNSIGLILPFSSEEDDLVMWENHLVYADPVCRKYD